MKSFDARDFFEIAEKINMVYRKVMEPFPNEYKEKENN